MAANDTIDTSAATGEQPAPEADVRPEPVKSGKSKRKSAASPAPKSSGEDVTGVVLVDYRGPAGCNTAMLSPLAIKTDDAAIMLKPGLTPLPMIMWDGAASHAGITKRIEAGEVAVLPEIPRRLEPRRQLIDRTYSAAGLDAIEADERARYGDKPRGVIVEQIARQRDKIARRTAIGPGKLVKSYKAGTNTVDILVDLVDACGLMVDRNKVEAALIERGVQSDTLIQLAPYNASNAPAQDQIRAMLKALKLRWSIRDSEFLVHTQ